MPHPESLRLKSETSPQTPGMLTSRPPPKKPWLHRSGGKLTRSCGAVSAGKVLALRAFPTSSSSTPVLAARPTPRCGTRKTITAPRPRKAPPPVKRPPPKVRAARRRKVHADGVIEARALGLTFLQKEKVGTLSQPVLLREWRCFLAWARNNGLSQASPEACLEKVPIYLDKLFFEGHGHDRGDKLVCAMRYLFPGSAMRDPQKMDGTLAALKGFRRLAHGQTRSPMAKQFLYSMVGLASYRGDQPMAVALCLGWDCYLRLPSDRVDMVGASLVPPTTGAPLRRWALLLYPEEYQKRSKTGDYDDGVFLTEAMSKALDAPLRRLRQARRADQKVWHFQAVQFRALFKELSRMLGSADAHPYQVRHGGASCDAAEGARPLGEIQQRLRHVTDATTKRYSKKVRYVAEIAKLDNDIRQYGTFVEENLGPIVNGKMVAKPPRAVMDRL